MPGRRSLRYHQRRDSDDEFETPALQIAAERSNRPQPAPAAADSDDEIQSESGLGESPEEDMDEMGLSSDDNNEDNKGHKPENDSDSGPEEVSFSKSREAEERRQQAIMGEVLRGKEKEKEWRKKKDELFKLQKKAKLAALKKRKLPAELLDELDQLPEKTPPTDPSPKNSKKEKEVGSSSEEEDNEIKGGHIRFEAEESDDFISLNTQDDQLQVVSLKKSQFVSPAANFKEAMMYGNRHKRVTSEQRRLKKAKRLTRR
ncbi:hypothetical protein ACOMHN_029497 [Nucella lapillus]